ncbi:MAG TPA: hypothetical protein VG057_21260 [Solirubrobacteraceae bacterium]|nr:hypothetical protein [Solirubrobacteraceae bacterium]
MANVLPEVANVYWRPRVTDGSLRRVGRLWTLSSVAHALPFVAGAVALGLAAPIMLPFAALCLVHAWAIPELYAARGARSVKPRSASGAEPEQVALGLLGDLVDHVPRELYAQTGLMIERGRLGVWLLGEAGALLLRPGGRRVNCYCVKATGAGLPPSDRVAHLLLALRTDESGFATVANLAFSGARWRVRRRLTAPARKALDAAARLA